MTKADVAQNVRLKLKMEKPDLAAFYSFPFFISDDNLHDRKIPRLYFECAGNLIQSPEKLGLSGGEMVQLAFDELRQRPVVWQVSGGTDNPAFVSYANMDAATKILDPLFLQQACNLLQTDELAVMIPNGDLIIAAPLANVAVNESFLLAAKAGLNKLSATVLSEVVFVYQEGVFSRIIDLLKTFVDEQQPDELYVSDGQLLNVVEIPVFTGDFFYKVEIGAPGDSQLLDLCERTIFHLLRKKSQDRKFLGIIEFVINRNTNPFSPELAARLSGFWDSLKESVQVQKLCRQMRRNIELSIVFSDHFSMNDRPQKMYLKIEYHK